MIIITIILLLLLIIIIIIIVMVTMIIIMIMMMMIIIIIIILKTRIIGAFAQGTLTHYVGPSQALCPKLDFLVKAFMYCKHHCQFPIMLSSYMKATLSQSKTCNDVITCYFFPSHIA